MAPRAWMILALATPALTLAVPGVHATEASTPSPLDATLGFGVPAQVHASVNLPGAWILQWLESLGGPHLDASSFLHEGDTVEASYVERVHVGTPLSGVTPPLGPVDEPVTQLHGSEPETTFYDFRVQLSALASVKELVVAGGADADPRLASSPGWRLSTVNAIDEILPSSPTGGVGDIEAGTLLLESGDVAVAAQGSVDTYYYGYEVILHHRDGVETYRTGVWSEVVPGPDGSLTVVLHEATLRLRADASWLEADRPAQAARLFAPALALDGVLDFEAAWGRVRVLDREERLAGHALRLDGAFLVTQAPLRSHINSRNNAQRLSL